MLMVRILTSGPKMTPEDHFERGWLDSGVRSLPLHSVELTSVVPGRLYRADTDDEPESPSRDRSTQGRDRLPHQHQGGAGDRAATPEDRPAPRAGGDRSEEHTSELQSLMRISSAVFCLKKTTLTTTIYRLIYS